MPAQQENQRDKCFHLRDRSYARVRWGRFVQDVRFHLSRALGGFLGTNKETPTFAFVSLKFPGLGASWTNKVRDRHEDRFTVETVTRSVVVKKACPNKRPHRSRTKVSIRVSDTQAYPSSLSLLSRAIQETFDSLIHYPLPLPHLLKVCEFWGLSRCRFGPLTIGYWDMAVGHRSKDFASSSFGRVSQ